MLLLLFPILSSVVLQSSAIDRHYYIAAVEVDWDYAPSGRNLATADGRFHDKIDSRIDRIGSTYRKAIYRGYTDGTFTQRLPAPEWAGLLGPPIKAETGDIVFVHFQNWASGSNFSVHPHGFLYNKTNEGALYIDGTSGNAKLDDAVPPGGAVTYVWVASAFHAPTNSDDRCAAFTYHSHTRAPKDIDTGLMGFAVFCQKGTLNVAGRRRDVEEEFYVYADIADEGNSWYADQNMLRCGNPTICRNLQAAGDDSFEASNRMAHINGFTYGNVRDFTTCRRARVVWYFMTINLGIHTIHANGQTMVVEGKRTDTVTLASASVYSGYMVPVKRGRWLLYCRNQDFYDDGMLAFLKVNRCRPRLVGPSLSPGIAIPSSQPGPSVSPSIATTTFTRYYYLAIEEVFWDYAPGVISSTIMGAGTFLNRGNQRIGSVYKKARYIEYTNQAFTVQKDHGIQGEHYGLAGPPIIAQVGDNVRVVVLNRATRPYSFLANGVCITKNNEGAWYKKTRLGTQMSGAIVNPGETRVYEFGVPVHTAPTALNANCITYVYHSAVDFSRDIYSGLFGPLLVCKRRTLTSDGSQIGVDREFFLNWMVIDENRSWYIDENIASFALQPSTVDKEDPDFQLSNHMRAINGRTFGTLTGLQMCLGKNVQWHMYGLGGQVDHHHFSFEGNNFKFDSRNLDTTSVFPGVGRTVTMIPDQTGRHLLRNGQLEFEYEGMYGWYHVTSCAGPMPAGSPTPLVAGVGGIVRRYYVGVVESNWDYAREKIDPIDGASLLDPSHPGFIFLRNDPPFLGTVYLKAMYREFTDGTFTTEKTRPPNESHLGLLGPFIRGNVGDTIEIVFHNSATFPYNIVPRNLVFTDGLPISDAPATMPGQTRTYSYFVPKRSGPTQNQPYCVGSIYASRVNPLNDTNSGLLGSLVICNSDILDFAGHRTDEVTIEFATGFVIFDENKSNYKHINFASTPQQSINEPDFIESNIYHSINGYIYGNLKGLVFRLGQHSAWYIFGLGSVEDIHTVHTHGQLYLRETSLSLKRDVLEVFAGTYETVEMLGYNPGTWLFHCHVAAHVREGMESAYTVLPGPLPGENPFGPTAGSFGQGRGPLRPGRGPLGPGRGPHVPGRGPMPPGRGQLRTGRGPLGPGRGPHVPRRGPMPPGRGPLGPGREPLRSETINIIPGWLG